MFTVLFWGLTITGLIIAMLGHDGFYRFWFDRKSSSLDHEDWLDGRR
jgi:hypothetical protein